jgi:hypothetical protein
MTVSRLAHHDAGLAPAIIAADPMGLIEYADAEIDEGIGCCASGRITRLALMRGSPMQAPDPVRRLFSRGSSRAQAMRRVRETPWIASSPSFDDVPLLQYILRVQRVRDIGQL